MQHGGLTPGLITRPTKNALRPMPVDSRSLRLCGATEAVVAGVDMSWRYLPVVRTVSSWGICRSLAMAPPTPRTRCQHLRLTLTGSFATSHGFPALHAGKQLSGKSPTNLAPPRLPFPILEQLDSSHPRVLSPARRGAEIGAADDQT